MVKQVFYSILLFLFSLQTAFATHIVGGEPQLLHLSDDQYRVGLVLYFDDINGDRSAFDFEINVHAYSKRTNEKIKTFRIALKENFIIPFSQPDCAKGEIKVRRMYYWTDKTLKAEDFADSEGYYMVWERCCRNAIIDNVNEPNKIGQAFYMEFPALQNSDGTKFINSTPSLFNAFADYPCVNQPFYMDLGSTDPDGDSLAYRLVSPLKGFSSDDLVGLTPEPRPGPYPKVEFINGISISNMIPGNPALQIDSKTGIISVTPSTAGLFVFAIACDEFRNGIKIGEIRKEFQLLVLDCPPANAPTVLFKPESTNQYYTVGDTLKFDLNQSTCGDIEIRDVNPNTEIILKIGSVNFNLSGDSTLLKKGNIDGTTDVFIFNVCFPICPNPNSDEPFVLDFFVQDNTCSVPLSDTLRVLAENFSTQIQFEIPNVFTPNGDGFNDVFGIPKIVFQNNLRLCDEVLFKMMIYNRWGRLIYQDDGANPEWDGGDFPAGMYFYEIIYREDVFKGSVSILKN